MLSAADKALYARQVLLTEIGEPGQARLLQSRVALPVAADPRAGEVAAEYLERAGLRVVAGAELQVALPSGDALDALAGRAELREAAAALAGAFGAVEAIKRALGAGEAASLPPSVVLAREPAP